MDGAVDDFQSRYSFQRYWRYCFFKVNGRHAPLFSGDLSAFSEKREASCFKEWTVDIITTVSPDQLGCMLGEECLLEIGREDVVHCTGKALLQSFSSYAPGLDLELWTFSFVGNGELLEATL